MSWKIESIAKERREKAMVTFADTDRAALIDRIVALETALYPLAYVLGSLDDCPGKGMHATSGLWPYRNDDDNLGVWNEDTKKFDFVEQPADDKLADLDAHECSSLDISDGSKLADDFTVLAVHQYEGAAYCSCGEIAMEDVRRAKYLLWPK